MNNNPFSYFGKLLKVSRKDRFFEVNEYLDAGYYALGDDIDGLEKMQHEDDPKPWYESDEDDSEDEETEDEDTEAEDEESESSSFNPFEVDPDAGGSFSPAYPSNSSRRYVDSINVEEGIFYMKDTEARMDIDALEERMDDAEARLDSLEDRMDTAEADIDALEDRMDVAENDIDNLEDRMDDAEDRLDDDEATLSDHESRITTLEECCEEVQDDIDGINSSITSINSSITSIKSSVSSNTTKITNLQNVINGLSLDNTTYVTKTVNVYLEAYGTYGWTVTSGSTSTTMYYLRCGCNYDSLLPSGDCIITYVDGVVPNDSIQVSPLYVTGKIDLANVNTSSVLSGDYEYRIYMIGALGSLSSGSKIAECEVTLGYIEI